jgi:hypothetical protein
MQRSSMLMIRTVSQRRLVAASSARYAAAACAHQSLGATRWHSSLSRRPAAVLSDVGW